MTMLNDNTLTKKEALHEYLRCARELEVLQLRLHNLEKIILGEVLVPERLREGHRLTPRTSKAPYNTTREAVLKTLRDNGGWMVVGEIAEATGIHTSTVSVCLRRGMPKGFVNIERITPKSFRYSIAVHGDQEMPNHG